MSDIYIYTCIVYCCIFWAENFRIRYPNPDYLIWVSNGHTLDFLLKPFFRGYSRENSKSGFLKLESPFVSVH